MDCDESLAWLSNLRSRDISKTHIKLLKSSLSIASPIQVSGFSNPKTVQKRSSFSITLDTRLAGDCHKDLDVSVYASVFLLPLLFQLL